jgi:hypothetical protein
MILAVLLALAALLGCVRLLLWQRRADPSSRSQPWRFALLLVAQPILAVVLHAMFVPPAIGGDRATLVVLTRGATFDLAQASGDRVVALPGAPTPAGAEQVPDLATALRRDPGGARLHIVGNGLDPRDRDAAAGHAIDFQAPPPPRGLVRIDPPGRVAPGAAFALGGAVAGVAGGTVELIDPAGRRVDVTPVGPDGGYRLGGTARAAGAALFTVRLRDSGRALVEDAAVPLIVAADPPPAVLLLAGAPGPEIKYLRRWATDAGLTLRVESSAGGGILLGDAPEPLTVATLQRYDLVILDERSWAGLGAGERAALGQAVAGGLGLLLRVTGPLPDAVRRQWQALGLTVAGGGETVAVAPAAAAPDAEAAAARRGPGRPTHPRRSSRAASRSISHAAPSPSAATRWCRRCAMHAAPPSPIGARADAAGSGCGHSTTVSRWSCPGAAIFMATIGAARSRHWRVRAAIRLRRSTRSPAPGSG